MKSADRKLDTALADLAHTTGGPPGVSALVDRGGKVRFHRAGRRTVLSGRPFRADDHVRIASTSKAFNGAVALILVDHGVLSLDDTIGEVRPDLPAAWSAVTLRELLQHTSGIPSYEKSPAFIAKFLANPRQYFSPNDIIDAVRDKGLEFPPGTRYGYSDTDNIVVALMAEKALGFSYERQLRKLLFKPLGLKQTSLPEGFDIPRPFIHGYDLTPGQPAEDVSRLLSMSGIWASGGMTSTPRDLNTFIRADVGGRLISKELRRQQLSFVPDSAGDPPGPGDNSSGLAVYRYQTKCGTVYGHTGNLPGYTQFIAASADGKRSVVVTANQQLSGAIGPPAIFSQLRNVFELAACAALAGKSR